MPVTSDPITAWIREPDAATIDSAAADRPPSSDDLDPANPVDRELALLRVTHIQVGRGRPRERTYIIDTAGLNALLDTLPPTDRVRLPSGREIAGRGGGSAASVDALVPTMTPEQVHLEVMRRSNRAYMDDLEASRRAHLEAHKQMLATAVDQQKMIRAMMDMQMEQMEKFADAAAALAQRQAGDLTEQIVGAVIQQLGGGGGAGGLLGAMRNARSGTG